MASNLSILLLFLPFIVFPLASSFNITKILSQFPDFNSFNNLLTQTQLANEINRRQALTILAVKNNVLSSPSSLTIEDVKKVLSLHVLLDYYDGEKLHKLHIGNTTVNTLFGDSGSATGKNGLLNVTLTPEGQISFSSAEPGSQTTSTYTKDLAMHPTNISVIEVSAVIVPPGIGGGGNSGNGQAPSQAPVSAPIMAPAPATIIPIIQPPVASPSKYDYGAPAPAPSNGASNGPLAPVSSPISGSPVNSPINSPPAPPGFYGPPPAVSPMAADGSPVQDTGDGKGRNVEEESSGKRLMGNFGSMTTVLVFYLMVVM